MHGRCTEAVLKGAQEVCKRCMEGVQKVWEMHRTLCWGQKSGFYVNEVLSSVILLAMVGTIEQSEMS